MRNIQVSTNKHYTVCIEQGLFDTAAQFILERLPHATSVIVVSDQNVFNLYGKQLCEQFINEHIKVATFTFPEGEHSKSFETLQSLLYTMQKELLTRDSIVVALGGGVTGDLAGLAASLYMRGCPLVQIPTTLLAMVDSSIGGKTAINLNTGKNLIGTFYQPNAVLIDINLLKSLPERIFLDGCAEIIKSFIIGNSSAFDQIYSHPLNKNLIDEAPEYLQEVIYHSVLVKRDIVSKDEKERGLRQLLNLGHTIGHAVEASSNYTLSHGQCVAIGLSYVTHLYAPHLSPIIDKVLHTHHLPLTTSYSAQDIYMQLQHDKKCHGNTVNLVIPQEIGTCIIQPVTLEELKEQLDTIL